MNSEPLGNNLPSKAGWFTDNLESPKRPVEAVCCQTSLKSRADKANCCLLRQITKQYSIFPFHLTCDSYL